MSTLTEPQLTDVIERWRAQFVDSHHAGSLLRLMIRSRDRNTTNAVMDLEIRLAAQEGTSLSDISAASGRSLDALRELLLLPDQSRMAINFTAETIPS